MRMIFTLIILLYVSINIKAQDIVKEEGNYIQITANSLEVIGKKFVEELNANYGKYVNTKYKNFNVEYFAEYIEVLKEYTLQFGTPISAKICFEERINIDEKLTIESVQISVSKIGGKYQLQTNEQDSLARSNNFRYKDRFAKFDALLQKNDIIQDELIIGKWRRLQNRMVADIKSPAESIIYTLSEYSQYVKYCNEKRSLYTYYNLEFLEDGFVQVKEGIEGMYSLDNQIIVDNYIFCGSWSITTDGLLKFINVLDKGEKRISLYKYYNDNLFLVGYEVDGKFKKIEKIEYDDVFKKVESNSYSSIKKEDSKTDFGAYLITAEVMPEPIGGLKTIRSDREGKVYVMAFINEEGNVTKAEILKGLDKAYDDMALKTILDTKFKPGKQRGKPVKVQVSIPVYFELKK